MPRTYYCDGFDIESTAQTLNGAIDAIEKLESAGIVSILGVVHRDGLDTLGDFRDVSARYSLVKECLARHVAIVAPIVAKSDEAAALFKWRVMFERALESAAWIGDTDQLRSLQQRADDVWPAVYALLETLRYQTSTVQQLDGTRADPPPAEGLIEEEHKRVIEKIGGSIMDRPTIRARRASKHEANVAARKFLRAHPTATVRELANAIDCSRGLAAQLSAWKAVNEERAKRRTTQPRAVAATPRLLATIHASQAQQEADCELHVLVSEQKVDQRNDERRAFVPRRRA